MLHRTGDPTNKAGAQQQAKHDCSVPAMLSSGACCISPAVGARKKLSGRDMNWAHERSISPVSTFVAVQASSTKHCQQVTSAETRFLAINSSIHELATGPRNCCFNGSGQPF